MKNINNTIKATKTGFSDKKNKLGINVWRFFFNAHSSDTAVEKRFFIEFEMLNPWISPEKTLLGFETRISFTEEDLQYALAGTSSAKNLKTENIIQPSYCLVRVGILGEDASQLCSYVPVKDLVFDNKNFEISSTSYKFTLDTLQGIIRVTEDEKRNHMEYFTDCGTVKWDIKYEIQNTSLEGFSKKDFTWFPNGISTRFGGRLLFNQTEYLIDPKRSFGYMERMYGKVLPDSWFHISSSNLKSAITGNQMFDSCFVVRGTVDNNLSLIAKFGDLDLVFDGNKANSNTYWDCQQTPEPDEDDDETLHWTASFSDKIYVIDIDIFCKIKELHNKNYEMPEGNRKILSMLEGGSGYGEIKVFRKQKKSVLELLEHVNVINSICEIGKAEENENN